MRLSGGIQIDVLDLSEPVVDLGDLFLLPILGKYAITEHLHAVDLLRGGDIAAFDDGVIRSVGVGAGIGCPWAASWDQREFDSRRRWTYYLWQARWGRKIASLRAVTGILC